MVIYKGRKIVYSFEYGGYAKKKELIIGNSIIGVALLGFLALCIVAGVMAEDVVKSELFWLSLIMVVIFSVLFFVVMLYSPFEKKHDEQIKKWLESVSIEVINVAPWEFSHKMTNLVITSYRFGVKFVIDGEEYCKTSKHYDVFYRFIKDKKIDILYIPEYDQVLVLE